MKKENLSDKITKRANVTNREVILKEDVQHHIKQAKERLINWIERNKKSNGYLTEIGVRKIINKVFQEEFGEVGE